MSVLSEWVIPASYLVGWLWTARTIAIRMVDHDAREAAEQRLDWRQRFREPHRDDGKPLVDTGDRIAAAFIGILTGAMWPLALLVLAFARTIRTPTEAAEADRVELARLRQLAREHNLPMPEDCP